MEQVTFADVEYEGKKRRTRRELFLERMEALIPWERLEARIRPLYPKAGRGRQPYPLAAMLRIHCVQLFYNLSDPGMEDMLYEIESVRRFAGLRLTGPLPDETCVYVSSSGRRRGQRAGCSGSHARPRAGRGKWRVTRGRSEVISCDSRVDSAATATDASRTCSASRAGG